MNIHDELHRLVLRKRWIRWSLKHYRLGDYNFPNGRHIILSRRLADFKPTWKQRHTDIKNVQ